MLADDVVVWTDGGGRAKAAPKPVMGAAKVRCFLPPLPGHPEGAEVIEANLNGQRGLLALYRGNAVSAVVVDIAEGRVNAVMVMANLDKLSAVNVTLAERQGARP